MPTEEPITLGEIYRTLVRVEKHIADVRSDHEQRIRKVERWVYAVPPTLLLALATIVPKLVE